MPLPAALAARLSKRGILPKKDTQQDQPEEEVIAENYDAPAQKKKKICLITSKQTEDDLLLANRGHEGCPNKYNVYHECTTFCVTLWKIGVLRPDPKYLRRKFKLLKQYPLPEGWKEVFDRGCGRYYFWNLETDEVSWYPPNHPKAKISPSAARIREAKQLSLEKMVETEIESNSESDLSSEDEEEEEEEDHRRKSKKFMYPMNRGQKRVDILDPMDPAAYSDTPRGTWSSGLENHADAKTGVDTTASGPLYQMRPYPSPGSVLAANAKVKKS
ncbi:polyglutamine-binding protein 1 [Chrysoperla carnea]|uniref:polyglutamine-binding protein 1 n=1 Tax=Chrysoperla carnea TaxID=189513 RepID=UPI001D068A7C|nr:polyglutamine-binding protein 1 [Chrysoperla carnea]